MVDKLYWEDAYMKEFYAVITAIDGAIVQLDRTAFYPTGGRTVKRYRNHQR